MLMSLSGGLFPFLLFTPELSGEICWCLSSAFLRISPATWLRIAAPSGVQRGSLIPRVGSGVAVCPQIVAQGGSPGRGSKHLSSTEREKHQRVLNSPEPDTVRSGAGGAGGKEDSGPRTCPNDPSAHAQKEDH